MPHPTIVSATLTEHAHSHGRAATRHRTSSPPPPLVSHSPPRPDSVTSFRRAESPSALSSHSRAELATEARVHQKKCVVDANCVSSRESKSCGSTMLLNGFTGSMSSGRCIMSGDHTSYTQQVNPQPHQWQSGTRTTQNPRVRRPRLPDPRAARGPHPASGRLVRPSQLFLCSALRKAAKGRGPSDRSSSTT